MKFIRGVKVLLKKELHGIFSTPLIYILCAIFSLIAGWVFFSYIISVKQHTTGTLTNSVMIPLFGVMHSFLMFFVPIITAPSFSLEKKERTLDLLFMSDLSEWQIIIGKFLSQFISIFFILSFTFVFPITLGFSGYQDWGIVFSGYLGLSLSLVSYISVGIFCSSLTENQFVSIFLTIAILIGLMLITLTANVSGNPLVGQILQYFGQGFHFSDLASGAIKSYHFMYYISFFSLFSFLTHQSLKSRKW